MTILNTRYSLLFFILLLVISFIAPQLKINTLFAAEENNNISSFLSTQIVTNVKITRSKDNLLNTNKLKFKPLLNTEKSTRKVTGYQQKKNNQLNQRFIKKQYNKSKTLTAYRDIRKYKKDHSRHRVISYRTSHVNVPNKHVHSLSKLPHKSQVASYRPPPKQAVLRL